jgi:hypothetical protein
MAEGFEQYYSEVELREAYFKTQLLSECESFQKSFSVYLDLSSISIETKYSKCFSLVRDIIKRVDELLSSIYEDQFAGCSKIIADKQVQNIKGNCFLLLQMTINQKNFQKYNNSFESFKNQEIKLLLEYLSQLEIIKNLQWLYPKTT